MQLFGQFFFQIEHQANANYVASEELGTDPKLWKDLTDLFVVAVPSIKTRCFPDNFVEGTSEFDSASSRLIALNSTSLVADLSRLEDMIIISRNILTVGQEAQNMAAKARLDQAMFKFTTLCIKASARGFPTDNTTRQDEEKWHVVIEKFKKLLIKCLQFMNNLVVQNERRKLFLWVELFDSSTDGLLTHYTGESGKLLESIPELGLKPPLLPEMEDEDEEDEEDEDETAVASTTEGTIAAEPSPMPSTRVDQAKSDFLSNPFLLYFGSVGLDVKKDLEKQGKPATASHIAAECRRRWQNSSDEDRQEWIDFYDNVATKYKDKRLQDGEQGLQKNTRLANEAIKEIADHLKLDTNGKGLGTLSGNAPVHMHAVEAVLGLAPMPVPNSRSAASNMNAYFSLGEKGSYVPITSTVPEPSKADMDDYRVVYGSDYGAQILSNGKVDLLKRLEPEPERTSQPHPGLSPTNQPGEQSTPKREESEPLEGDESQATASEDSLSDDDGTVIPGDDARGILTDVPLILSPGEIEALPMIIQSGIVPPNPSTPGYGRTPSIVTATRNMHTVRCHLLLAQEHGRNLLRELLIFVAAWDLREDELYFKIMLNIMQAILLNGLMQFAYNTFREHKDIISPAQAVIMKLLTSIFRARQGEDSKRENPQDQETGDNAASVYPLKVDVHLVSYLFTEFRRQIIPQVCALIFLQGKIRDGTASPEDFPLNLWDMERMYEGIYQYLEFFAILTEHDAWKRMMADWDITNELVTLLEELDIAIPLSTPRNHALQQRRGPLQEHPGSNLGPQASTAPPQPVAVERPYEVSSSSQPTQPAAPPPAPLAADQGYAQPPLEDEPSNFEWRNLKKLAVLVLSSLVWKSKQVQEQLGKADSLGRPGRGIRALLNCCKMDDYNPYIKEHAIMALRFALEGNEANQQVVKNLSGNPPPVTLPSMLNNDGETSAPAPAQSAPNWNEVFAVNDKLIELAKKKSKPGGPLQLDGIDIPKEVLQAHGYETFVDDEGQMKIARRKNFPEPVIPQYRADPSGKLPKF
jgi:palmitoyltransferase